VNPEQIKYKIHSIAFTGILLNSRLLNTVLLNLVHGLAHDTPIDIMCGTKCHAEQSATSHIFVMGATSWILRGHL